MNFELSRRQFLGTAGAGLAGTALGAFGFGEIEAAYAETIRPFKLVNTTETRNTCPYCSVACGVIMYSKGDLKKGEPAELIHIEGDTDHPTNRGTLCPKGAALLDFVKAADAAPISDAPQARRQQIRAHFLGAGARPHRAADEGRPRRQFHRQEQ